ncbi:hypothetical protein JRO89_XS05G0004700 [Xanthoceras sorbifolium]|uniref:Uncharacterized protein n=1 Tax=Xanthoceras sorbifolium TaxID=99658 RepID=A0ABQ8HZM2_9ROSI|nr:hypothetical protein JRO89_XS05G0004700 [Xanthoceras sorbifolium]
MNRKQKTDKSDDEVDQLLQAAQDDVLLKLSVDSHISHLSPNHIDSDLDRRFQALKSRLSIPPPPSSSSSKPKSPVHRDFKTASGDDLSARFAALKASSSVSSFNNNEVPDAPNMSDPNDDDNSDNEVDKVIRWAMDAARLDPSPPSDDDEEQGAVANEKAHHK